MSPGLRISRSPCGPEEVWIEPAARRDRGEPLHASMARTRPVQSVRSDEALATARVSLSSSQMVARRSLVRLLGTLVAPRPVTHSMYRRPLRRLSATCDMPNDPSGSITKRSTSSSGTERDRTRPAMRTLSGPIATNPVCARTMIRADNAPTGKSTMAQKIRAPIGPSTNTAAMTTPQLSIAQRPAASVMPARNLAGAVHLRFMRTLSARALRRLRVPACVMPAQTPRLNCRR